MGLIFCDLSWDYLLGMTVWLRKQARGVVPARGTIYLACFVALRILVTWSLPGIPARYDLHVRINIKIRFFFLYCLKTATCTTSITITSKRKFEKMQILWKLYHHSVPCRKAFKLPFCQIFLIGLFVFQVLWQVFCQRTLLAATSVYYLYKNNSHSAKLFSWYFLVLFITSTAVV